MMTSDEFVKRITDVAQNRKTVYVLGCFGSPMTEENKRVFMQKNEYNGSPKRRAAINAADDDTFGFDCSCLIKAILWGWSGDKNDIHGGAVYASNGVPDYCADHILKACKETSTDFSDVKIGEVVWLNGHIGVYIGGGLAVEATPKWRDGVQITSCNRFKLGYKRRNWNKHGKLPYIEYK